MLIIFCPGWGSYPRPSACEAKLQRFLIIWDIGYSDVYTVKPDLKTTSIKRPPVLRDHFQILPRVITVILTCIKRPPLFKDQTTFLPQNFFIKRPLFPSNLHFMSKPILISWTRMLNLMMKQEKLIAVMVSSNSLPFIFREVLFSWKTMDILQQFACI